MLYTLILFTKGKDPLYPHFSRLVSCYFLETLSLLLLPRPSGFVVLRSLEGINEEKARRTTGVAARPSMRVQRVEDWTSIQLGRM